MNRKSKIWVAGAICSLALAGLAPAAGAQTAAQEGYDESGFLGSVDQGNGPNSVNATTDEGGSLPFTGLDLGILLALGGTAAGAGYVMRRAVRDPAQP
jgi:hypothetical protein